MIRWCEVVVFVGWIVWWGGIVVERGTCRTVDEAGDASSTHLQDIFKALNETTLDSKSLTTIVQLLVANNNNNNKHNATQTSNLSSNQTKRFTYEPTVKTSNELDEKIKSHHMRLVFERQLKFDPAILLLILQNDTDILLTRRVNKYYYWEFAQTTSAMVIFCMVVVGNLSILYKLKSFRRRRSNVNYFIVQLAIVDLLVGIFNVTLDSVFRLQKEFTYGLLACRTSKYISNLFIYASTFMLVALSIDRWEAVVRPLAFTRNRNRGCYLVLGAWALAALSATPVTLHTNIKHIEGIPQCWIVLDGVGWRIYTVYVTCSVLVVPALIIAICYTHIVHTIWSKGRQVQREKRKHQQHLEDRLAAAEQCSSSDDESPGPALPKSAVGETVEDEEEDYAEKWVEKYALNDCLTPPLKEVPEHSGHEGKASGGWRNNMKHHQANTTKKVATCKTIEAYQDGVAGSQHGHSVIPRARIKTIKMTLVIVVTFVLCWAPFCIINLCSVFDWLPRNSSLSVALATLSQSLAHLNSAVNPIIFWLFSSRSGSRSSTASGTSKSGASAGNVAVNTFKSREKVPTITCDKASRM